VMGGGCGRPASGGLSFSITKSVATKHPVDVTSPHIARGCRPMLQLIIAADRTADVRRTWWPVGSVCGGGGTGRRTCWRVSLQSPLVSLPPRPPRMAATHGDLSGARARTDGSVRGGARWSPAFDCTRRQRCCSITNSSTL